MRDAARFVIVGARLRHFDAARFAAPAEECLAARVVDDQAIDQEPVVVEPGDRRWHGDRPDTLVVPRHIDGALAEPVVGASRLQLHFLRNRCGQPKCHAAIRMDARILRVHDIRRRRLRVVCGRLRSRHSGSQGRDQDGHDQSPRRHSLGRVVAERHRLPRSDGVVTKPGKRTCQPVQPLMIVSRRSNPKARSDTITIGGPCRRLYTDRRIRPAASSSTALNVARVYLS